MPLKTIHYNEYGAPIEKNPGWCNFLSRLFNELGGICFTLNGGLEKALDKNNWLSRLMWWLWVESYAWSDLQCKSEIKGYRQELPK